MTERFLACLLAMLLAGCTSVVMPTAGQPTASSIASPDETEHATTTPSATGSPTARPTASPTPSASAPGGLETLELEATGCPGGVALDWSPTTQPEFHHYTALRSLEDDVSPDYPPIAPAVDWGDSYATDRFVTSAVDATLIPSETSFSYRVMAYDARDRAVAASVVRRTRPSEVVDLGTLTLEAGGDGSIRLDWRLFGGLPACFSGYRVVIGPGGGTPSTLLTVISDQSTTELETAALRAGETYAVRVEAVRTTTLGGFVVAHTETASYAVP
jgi:hypothetical protein